MVFKMAEYLGGESSMESFFQENYDGYKEII
jgi:hypothetical protein